MKTFKLRENLNHDASGVVATHPAFAVGMHAAQYRVSNVFGAGGDKMYLCVWHAASATRHKLLMRAYADIVTNSAAALVDVDLCRITSAPTGGTTFTVVPSASGLVTGELSAMYTPTGGAATTPGQYYSAASASVGIIVGTTLPPGKSRFWEFEAAPDKGIHPPALRAGTLEGYAIRATVSAATTLVLTVGMEFSDLTA